MGDTQVEKVFKKSDRLASGNVESGSSGAITTVITIPNWLNTLWEYVKLGIEHIWNRIRSFIVCGCFSFIKTTLD